MRADRPALVQVTLGSHSWLLRERLYKIKGIRHSKSSFVLRTLKKADLPLPFTAASAR